MFHRCLWAHLLLVYHSLRPMPFTSSSQSSLLVSPWLYSSTWSTYHINILRWFVHGLDRTYKVASCSGKILGACKSCKSQIWTMRCAPSWGTRTNFLVLLPSHIGDASACALAPMIFSQEINHARTYTSIDLRRLQPPLLAYIYVLPAASVWPW